MCDFSHVYILNPIEITSSKYRKTLSTSKEILKQMLSTVHVVFTTNQIKDYETIAIIKNEPTLSSVQQLQFSCDEFEQIEKTIVLIFENILYGICSMSSPYHVVLMCKFLSQFIDNDTPTFDPDFNVWLPPSYRSRSQDVWGVVEQPLIYGDGRLKRWPTEMIKKIYKYLDEIGVPTDSQTINELMTEKFPREENDKFSVARPYIIASNGTSASSVNFINDSFYCDKSLIDQYKMATRITNIEKNAICSQILDSIIEHTVLFDTIVYLQQNQEHFNSTVQKYLGSLVIAMQKFFEEYPSYEIGMPSKKFLDIFFMSQIEVIKSCGVPPYIAQIAKFTPIYLSSLLTISNVIRNAAVCYSRISFENRPHMIYTLGEEVEKNLWDNLFRCYARFIDSESGGITTMGPNTSILYNYARVINGGVISFHNMTQNKIKHQPTQNPKQEYEAGPSPPGSSAITSRSGIPPPGDTTSSDAGPSTPPGDISGSDAGPSTPPPGDISGRGSETAHRTTDTTKNSIDDILKILTRQRH
jgi:hypothetical protein